MSPERFAEYLEERYEDQLAYLSAKAGRSQKLYKRLQWTVIVLSAVTPVLIQLDVGGLGEIFMRLALGSSVAVAILTTGLKTFNYQEEWVRNRATAEVLKREKHLYEARLGGYRTAGDREARFVGRVEALLAEENAAWVANQSEQEGEPEAEEVARDPV